MSQQQTQMAPGLPEKPRFVPGFVTTQDIQQSLFQSGVEGDIGNLLRAIVVEAEGDLGTKGEFLPGRFAYPIKVDEEKGITAETVATSRDQVKRIKAAVKSTVKARAKAAAKAEADKAAAEAKAAATTTEEPKAETPDGAEAAA